MNERMNCALPLETSGHNLTAALLVVAATTLSLAAYDSGGTISPTAIRWLMIAVAAAIAALLSLFAPLRPGIPSLLRPVLLGCLCAQFAALLWSPIDYPTHALGLAGLRSMMVLLALAAVIAGSLCSDHPWFGKWTFPILLLIQTTLGFVMIKRLAMPGIDVLMFQRESCAALLQGYNPYAIRFPDPYPPQASAMFYGPGVSVNGILQFGYPYMPMTLLMALPGYLLGDVRYAGLACVAISCALLAYAKNGATGKAAVTLLMFSPIGPLVLVLAWTESYVLLLLALTVFCHLRKPKLTPYAFGLLLVSKQYMLGMAPLGLLLLPRPWKVGDVLRFAAKSAAIGAFVTLPLVLWNVKAFWDSAITLQTRQPYRPDALSLLVWARPVDPSKWTWLPFVGLGMTMLIILKIALRRAIPFAMALALCLLAFFALNKQAFANYYFLVIGAMLLYVTDSRFQDRNCH